MNVKNIKEEEVLDFKKINKVKLKGNVDRNVSFILFVNSYLLQTLREIKVNRKVGYISGIVRAQSNITGTPAN